MVAVNTVASWLTTPALSSQTGSSRAFELAAPRLDQPVHVRTWSPADAPDDEPLPLLLVHDGPEYDELANLTRYISAGVAEAWLPRLRVALLGPGHRDLWYSANPSYARALRSHVLPRLTSTLATTSRTGMGASLGALAMLHVHCRYPDALDALFLQSGSFFCPRTDEQERRFAYYRRVVRFVASVHDGRSLPARPVPTVLTCGSGEENLANNKEMATALRAAGYDATLHEVPGGHDYPAWRDALDPHLTRLLVRMNS
jgi:enterochelin esterase family protein